MMNISPKTMEDLRHLVIAHLINDGENEADATVVANLVCEDLANGSVVDTLTLLWDALSFDDEGYVAQNPELQALCEEITEAFEEAPSATKH